jgi:hypothetical protein
MRLKLLLSAIAIASLPAPIWAQGTTPTGTPLVVTGVPYSAQEWKTVTFSLSGGTATSLFSRVDVTRNSAGSTRREFRILASSSATAQPTGSLYVDIHDVPNSLAVHLDPTTSQATVNPLKKSNKPFMIPASVPVGAVVSGPPQNLGFNSVAGFSASGTRQSYLFPKGTKSPDQDVTQTTDTWYSADLQANVLVQTQDSLGNSVVTSLQQIVQGEPDPALFTIPQSYTTTVIGKSAQSTQ